MLKKIQGTLHKIRYNNPFVNGYYANKRKETLTANFLNSAEYDALMTKYSDSKNFMDETNDAEAKSENFIYRHMRCHKILGCWRWKVLWQKKEVLIPTLFDMKQVGIDFGGANGPVSFHAKVVDFAAEDTFNRKVIYKDLKAVNEKVDYIFSSHTLEHIKDLDLIFNEMKEVLKKEGKLFFHVPAYTCTRWRSGLHTNRSFNDHAWTFHLAKDTMDEEIINPMAFDTKVAEHFNVQSAEYVGDNSIFIVARN